MYGMFFAPFAMLFEFKFALYTFHIFMRVVVVALTGRTPETDKIRLRHRREYDTKEKIRKAPLELSPLYSTNGFAER